MRTPLCALAVLAACLPLACSPREDAADTADTTATGNSTASTGSPAQRRIATHGGTWMGRTFRSDADTGIAWTNVVNVMPDSSLTGSLRFAEGGRGAPVAVTYLQMTDSTAILELGPYYSPTVKAEVMTRVEARVRGDSMWGNYDMRPTKGGAPTRGRLAAKRTAAPTS
jgi:hypothetical protein